MSEISSVKLESSELWPEVMVRKEQLRATIAIAAIAACYYSTSKELGLSGPTGDLMHAIGVLLVSFWGFYLILIAAATANDLRILPVSEDICRRLRRVAHLFYGLGVAAVLFIILFFAAVQLPAIAGWVWKLIQSNETLIVVLDIATVLFVSFGVLPAWPEYLNRHLTK